MSDSERGPASDEPVSEEFKAFVGGISWHISDRELKDKFREFDAIGARVQLDKATGRSRGFGFVMFADEKGLKNAVAAMHQTDLDGRKISVTRAIPQSETVPGTPAAALNAGRRGSYGGGYDRRGPPGYGGGRFGGGGAYGAPDRMYRGGGGGYADRGGYGYERGPDRGNYSREAPYGGSYPPRAQTYPDQRYDRSYGGAGYGGYETRAPEPYAGAGYGRDAYGSRDYSGYDYGPPPAAAGGYSRDAYSGRSAAYPAAGGGYPDRYIPDDRSGAAGFPPERSAYRGPAGDRPGYGAPPRPGGPP